MSTMPQLLLSALLLALPTAWSAAAPVSWSGQGDGVSWSDGANWSPPGLPTAADAVTISSSGAVIADNLSGVNVASLTLGDGISSTTLRVSTGVIVAGELLLRSTASLEFAANEAVVAGAVVLEPGSLVTHMGPVTASTVSVFFNVGSFDLRAGATVALNANGFRGGLALSPGIGPGAGGAGTLAGGGGGAGHAAPGGIGGTIANSGAAYGHVSAAFDLGSGGGGALAPCFGGAGGGRFRLQAASATLNGSIEANGAAGGGGCGVGGGGGSGGTLRISAADLFGAGTLSADGGAGGNGGVGGGGGAGGRVSIISTGSLSLQISISSAAGGGGAGSPTGTPGGTGSVFLDPKEFSGAGGGICTDPLNWAFRIQPQPGEHVVFGSAAPMKNCDWSFGNLSIGSMTLRSGYLGILTWSSFTSEISGSLSVDGGTFASSGVQFNLGGDLTQTGGVFSLTAGTAAFIGASSQTVRVSSSAVFNNVRISGDKIWSIPTSLDINGNVSVIAPSTAVLAGGATVFLAGDIRVDAAAGVIADAGHSFVLDGGAFGQLLQIPRLGGLRVRAGATGRLPAAYSISLASGVSIEAGGRLEAMSAVIASSGDWNNQGVFDGTGGTAAFGAAGATQTIVAGGGVFGDIRLDTQGAMLHIATDAFVAGNMHVLDGVLDMGGGTHSVRGNWFEASSATVRGAASTVIFEGAAAQSVTQSPDSNFNALISSNPAGVRFTTDTTVSREIEMHRGALDFSMVALRVAGDFLRLGGEQPVVAGSTLSLNGSGGQRMDVSPGPVVLDSLELLNSAGVVHLDSPLTLERNLKIATGTVVFASTGPLRMQGGQALLDAYGADYRAIGPLGHRLELAPPAGESLFIAAGSTLGASIDILGDTVLSGDLFLDGTAQLLSVAPGASLDARGSTITLGAVAEMSVSPGGTYLRDANSWIVFAGSGTDRGTLLSTGPFGNMRVAPEDAAASFRFHDISLEGSFVHEGGVVRNATGAVLSAGGDFLIRGAGFDFASMGSSTVRLNGNAVQTASVPADARLYDFHAAGTGTVVISTGSSLTLAGDFLLSGGSVRASDAFIRLEGDWTGSGGLFIGENSTVAFAAGGAAQTMRDVLAQNFHALSVSSGTRVFEKGFSADLFTALQPATTLQFAGGETFTISTLVVNGNSLANPVVIESTAPGVPAFFSVGDSTVTAASVRDNDASAGSVIFVNDGRSVDAGGTVNWNFTSDLILIAPGETFVETVGKVGTPDTQVAGTTFTVTVLAVSNEFFPVPSSTIAVTVVTGDLYDGEPEAKSLSAGSAVFDLTLRTAEPGPFATVAVPKSPDALGQTGSTISVTPGAFTRLQMLLPGEGSAPGSPSGKSGVGAIQVSGNPFPLTIRGTDAFWNLVSTTGAGVFLSSTTAPLAALPAPLELVAGSTVFSGVILTSTGVFTVTASHAVDGSILPVEGSTFPVFGISPSSPTVVFDIPKHAVVGTLSGSLTGSAADSVAVAVVRLAIQDTTELKYYDWSAGTFTAPSPMFQEAQVDPFRGESVSWRVPLEDSKLVEGRSYFVVVRATNPSELDGILESTFTFRAKNLLFSPGDGEGTAFLASAAQAGCGVVTTTLTFTTGPSGIGPGGAVAVRVPHGWTKPIGLSAGASPPVGYALVTSTSPAWTVPASSPVFFNPSSSGNAALGDNWILVAVATDGANSFSPGETLVFSYAAIAPAGSAGMGGQYFDVRTRHDADGELVSLSTTPVLSLTTGPPQGLAFSNAGDLILAPLQIAPTAQIHLTDACGNETPASASLNVFLRASVVAPASLTHDENAEFFPSGANPRNFVTIPAGSSRSESFYYRTSTTAVGTELLVASATLASGPAQAQRRISLRPSAVEFSGVSIDSGTLAPGATSVVLTPGTGSRAIVRFRTPQGPLFWSVALGTAPGFSTAFSRQAGGADEAADFSIPFDPVRCDGSGCRFLRPGAYPVLISGAGGSLEDRSLEMHVANSPFLFGTLGAAGAGADVRVDGPGSAQGRFDRADASGYFEIRGLKDGAAYSITAATQTVLAGASVRLSTAVGGIVAASGGTDAGTLGFDAMGTLRVSIGIPVPAPTEFYGSAAVESADASLRAFATLHYAQGAARSDDGAQILGRDASTWTVLGLPAGIYSAQVELAALGISSRITGIAISSGQTTDLPVTLLPRSSLHGRVVLPAPPTLGAFVAVQAISSGSAIPSIFGGAFVPASSGGPAVSSAPYSLFGLSPGSWTIRAESRGFKSTSSVLFVAGTEDIGDSLTGENGLDLGLELGSVLNGSVTVVGNTASFDGSQATDVTTLGLEAGPGRYFVLVDAYNPATFARVGAVVEMATAAASAVSTFSIAGLDPGEHWVSAGLAGFRKDPAGIARVVVSTAAQARADIFFRTPEARARISVLAAAAASPCRCAEDFNRIGVVISAPDGSQRVVSDITALDGSDGASFSYFDSSFTFLTPTLASGFHRFIFKNSEIGTRAESVVSVALGSTATASVDLNAATVAVTGVVSFTGMARFLGDGFSVSVSSLPGLLANSSTGAYCLLGATAPVVLDSLRVELIPIDSPSFSDAGALLLSGAAGCDDFTLTTASAAATPALTGYAAQLAADGSFSFGSVPLGVYRVRVPGDLDGSAVNGREIAPYDALVRISSPTALAIPLRAGSRVSGMLRAPAGVTVDRPLRLSLQDKDGKDISAAVLSFNQERARAFSFDAVADGEYALTTADLGAYPTLTAGPRRVSVYGEDAGGIEVVLQQGGNIVGRVAVEQRHPDGSRSFVALSGENREMLGPGTRVVAVANPWVEGGFKHALGDDCDSDGCALLRFDANGQFLVPALLDGTYDLEFNIRNGEENTSRGSLDLASAVRAGLTVRAGKTTDAGIVRLLGAATLRGTVADAQTGAGLPNIRVRATPSQPSPGSASRRRADPETETDSSGGYALRGLDPEIRSYDITAAPRGGDPSEEGAPAYQERTMPSIDVLSTSTLDFSLLPAGFAASGWIRSEDGGVLESSGERETQPGALLVLRRDGIKGGTDSFGEIRGRSAADGRFSIPHLAAGTYRLTVFADGYAPRSLAVAISSVSASLGAIALNRGATVSGTIRNADGTAPGEDEIESIFAATPDGSARLFGSLLKDPNTRTIARYRISGLAAESGYRILLKTATGEIVSPEAGRFVAAISSVEIRTVDLIFRRGAPSVFAKSRRDGNDFLLAFQPSQPLRARSASDDDAALLLSTVSAAGTLSGLELASDRRVLHARYSPGVGESSFTLRFRGYSALRNPESADPVNPEFLVFSTFTFFAGLDEYNQAVIPNLTGGGVALPDDPGRVRLPEGAFLVDASSSVRVALQRSGELLQNASMLQAAGYTPEGANLKALRFSAAGYPPDILRAIAATPPAVLPKSAFYNVLLPPGVPRMLAKPAELTLRYFAGTDPANLRVYWYNAAANAYVMQTDAGGMAPHINAVERTLTIRVNHFSTFVLFDSGAAVISGNQFSGDAIDAFNFPNPFSLENKTVTPIHGVPARTVRGTLIRFALPPALSGEGSVRIYTIAGRRIRSINLGILAGGQYYYQAWDGRTEEGEDAASGVYIGQIKVGGKSAFFKMALIK